MCVDFMAQWPVEGERWPEIGETVNVSQGNAMALLELLGFGAELNDDELCGETGPDDFAGRILVARGLLGLTSDAEGIPATTDGGPGTGRARWVECGRRPGYLAGRLDDLETVVADAAAHNGEVVWA